MCYGMKKQKKKEKHEGELTSICRCSECVKKEGPIVSYESLDHIYRRDVRLTTQPYGSYQEAQLLRIGKKPQKLPII